jgi:phosphoribosylanthranilate isomerase
MNLKLKVCGMREPGNILEVAALQPDFMGFIFYDQSPRCVSRNFRLPRELSESVKKVGVFVNDQFERVFDTVDMHELDYAQLHGDETVGFCEKLKQADLGVIKVFSVDDNFDFKYVSPYKAVCDFFLFDTKGKFYGGNASAFDWSLLQRYDQEIPFFLSGGISAANIQQVSQLKDLNLYAIDVNSGVETEPGVKDAGKVREVQSILNA